VKRLLLVLLILPLLGPAVAGAQTTRYVSDRLEIPLRTGTSVRHRIVRMLPSGTPVEVLETSREGYTQVRTEQGAEGWVLTRYLMDTPHARDRVTAAEQKAATLELENKRLAAEVQTLSGRKAEVEGHSEALVEENRTLSQELEAIRRTAANSLNIAEQNRALKQELIKKEKDLQNLLQQNAQLKDRSKQDWFLVGAIVVLVSMFLGYVLPKLRFRSRSSWDRF
jgi:SH3 domain protein